MESRYTLPKEFALKWVQTLKTTELEQGKTGLLAKDGYCCLGIACVVAGARPHMIFSERETAIKDIGSFLISNRRFYRSIPKQIKGGVGDSPLISELVKMNDSGTSFKDIASWIEKNVTFV